MRYMKKAIWFVIIVVVFISLVFLVNDKNGDNSSGTIKIGVATILTSDFASLGENIVKTAELAVEEINEDGGINGKQIKLVVEDAGLDSKTGLSAVEKLVNVDGVKYIIGGTTSNGTLASAVVVNDKKVIYMTPVTGGNNVDLAGEYIFRVANSDVLAGDIIAKSMIEMGFKNVAVVSEITEYTLDINNKFIEEVENLGSNVVFKEQFQPDTTDFRTIVAKLNESEAEAVLILSQTGISGAHFLNQLKEQKLDLPVFSDFTFIANKNAEEVAGTFEGIYFADPAYDEDNEKRKEFFEKYENKFGMAPIIPFHTSSTYDSIHMLKEAIEAVGDDSEKVKEYLLENIKDYRGFMGSYSLDQNGNSDLGFVMKRVVDGEFIKLEK